MQLFGLAATVLVLPVAVWGWRIATHRPFDREWMRLSFWLAGTVFGAGFAACLPKSAHWPLPTGLGGVIGDAMLRAARAGVRRRCRHRAARDRRGLRPLHARRRRDRHRLRLSRSVATSSSTSAGRARPRAPRTTTRSATSISLGWLVHALLSIKARIAAAGDAPLGKLHCRGRRSAARRRRSLRRAIASSRALRRSRRATTTTRSKTRTRTTSIAGAAPRAQAARAEAAPSAQRRLSACPRSRCSPRRSPPTRFAPSPESIQENAHVARKRAAAISACAARSSTRGPARWSRSTSSSPRPASSRRA